MTWSAANGLITSNAFLMVMLSLKPSAFVTVMWQTVVFGMDVSHVSVPVQALLSEQSASVEQVRGDAVQTFWIVTPCD